MSETLTTKEKAAFARGKWTRKAYNYYFAPFGYCMTQRNAQLAKAWDAQHPTLLKSTKNAHSDGDNLSFWKRFTPSPSGCMEWRGAKVSKYGYGVLGYKGQRWLAHRLAYTLTKGEIPSGMEVGHLCDNPPCGNPEHLELCTHAENKAYGKGKKHYNIGENNHGWQGRVSSKYAEENDQSFTKMEKPLSEMPLAQDPVAGGSVHMDEDRRDVFIPGMGKEEREALSTFLAGYGSYQLDLEEYVSPHTHPEGMRCDECEAADEARLKRIADEMR